jgi:hypothetical protein
MEVPMGRLVQARPRGTKPRFVRGSANDSYLERVAKYVPAEVIAAYVVIVGLTGHVGLSGRFAASLTVFLCCLVLTPAYLWRMGHPGETKVVHMLVSSIAFAIWAYAVGGAGGIFGPDGWNVYDASWASIALTLFTLASGLVEPVKP